MDETAMVRIIHTLYSNRNSTACFCLCTDTDECASNPCHPNATCSNTEGGYNCTCKGNFEGDGRTCFMICQNGFQLNGSVCSKFVERNIQCSCSLRLFKDYKSPL